MTAAIAFDTHRFVKRLTECGFTERQAETLADEHVALLNANLATKTDIAEIKAGIDRVQAATKADIAKVAASVETLREETKAEIAKVAASVETLREETRAEIAKVEAWVESGRVGLLKWLIGAWLAQGALIVALVGLL